MEVILILYPYILSDKEQKSTLGLKESKYKSKEKYLFKEFRDSVLFVFF